MAVLREGDRISNYLLERRVGGGSFGEVWRAKHHVFGDAVAIKIPTDAQFVKNLQREGVAIHGLKHPNIVRAIDLDPYADPPYLVMEFIDGPSLRTVMEEQRAAFPIPAAVTVLRGALRALSAAHAAGLIHRDVKPANILLNIGRDRIESITEQAVKITDFGLGAVCGSTTQSMMQSGSLLTDEGRSIAGTWAYMSPEQKEGTMLDARSDLYSCGIILFEMLTGERPQGFDLPTTVRKDLPAWVDEVFRRAYTRLDRRYASADEMLAALEGPSHAATHVDTMVPPAYFPPFEATACPACRNAVESEDQFCVHCGKQLAASVPRCPVCKGYLHHTDRFCIFCGKDLGVLS
ncbi:MAG: serine/threonine-protein kinase [Planctomycetota bacterium]